MAEDYGLLSGLAKGINAGLDAYEKAQDRQERIKKYKDELEVKGLLRQQQKELADRKEKLDLYKAGATIGENGEIIADEENPNFGAAQSRQRYQDALSASVFGKEALESAKLDQAKSLREKELEQQLFLKSREMDQARALKEKELEQRGGLINAQIGKLNRPAPAKTGRGGDVGGKRLTPSMIEQQSSAKYINDTVLKDLAGTLQSNEEIIGPAQGLLGKAAGFVGVGNRAERQRVLQSQIDAGVQEIGKFLEGGKLAEGDLARYREMAPKVTDPPNVFRSKLQNLSRLVAQKQRVNLQALKESGYDTSGIGQASELNSAPVSNMSREEKLRRLKQLEGGN